MPALCRLCGKQKSAIDLIVELKDKTSQQNLSFKNIIERYCHVELDSNKLLPQSVCDECKEFIDKIISFCDDIEAVQIKLIKNQFYNIKECFVQLQEIGGPSNHNNGKRTTSTDPKKEQTIEELFEDEINQTSELVLYHLNVPASEGTLYGRITVEGLEMVHTFRWKNVSYKCVECDETAMKSLTDLKEHVDKTHDSKSIYCPLCSFGMFKSVHEYMNHITTVHHEHLKLCCPGCSKMFYDVLSLYTHIKTKHHKFHHLIVPCLCCGMFLENMTSLKVHRQQHLNELTCNGVSVYKDIFSSMLDEIAEGSLDLKLTERYKDSDGTVKESCKEKFTKWCKIKLACMNCTECDMDPFQLHLHYYQQHPLHKGPKFGCMECEKSVDCIYNFLNHYTNNHENHLSYNCVVCSKLYWNFTALQIHYLECHPVLKVSICLHCGQVFSKASQLIVHVKQKHNMEVNCRVGMRIKDDGIVKQELDINECEMEEIVGVEDDSCDESQESNLSLIQLPPKKKQTRNVNIEAASTIDELFRDELNDTSEIPLNHLNVPLNERLEHGRISMNGLRLISELRWHDIDYNCYTCGSNFNSVIDLKNHVKKNHTKNQLMNCSKCTFGEGRTVITYLNHLMTKHYEHLRFCCFICSTIFYDVSTMWKHLTQMHKDIADQIIPCLICGIFLNSLRDLKQHKVTHITQENVESYRTYKINYATELEINIMDSPYNMALLDCDKNADGSVSNQCTKKYPLWNELFLKCHECSVEAMVLPEFHLHCEREHGETVGSKYFCEKCPAESFGRLCSFLHHNAMRHDQQLKFCCVVCSQMFWNYTALYRHYRACHPNFKFWICLICGYHSFSYNRLNEHTVRVHGIGNDKQGLTPLQKQLKLKKFKEIQKTIRMTKQATKVAVAKATVTETKPKLKQNRRRTIEAVKLPANIKTIEELFSSELTGTSTQPLMHLYVSKEFVLEDGSVMDEGLVAISPIRWSDISYRCPECQDTFKTIITLKDHVFKRHKVRKTFDCSKCPNGNSRAIHGFVNHVTTKHYEHLKMCCIICSKMYYDVSTLWIHFKQSHRTREVLAPCLICGIICKSFLDIKQHKMAHLNQESMDSHQMYLNGFAKEINGVMMESKYNLAIPDYDKNADGTVKAEACIKFNKWNEVTQICRACPSQPMTLPDYYLHLDSDHPELRGRKYSCHECPSEEYNRINAFIIHNMTRHGTHLSYCCVACSQMFWNYAALYRHYRECHPAYKRQICLFCGHQFSDIFKVNEHAASIHGLKKSADGKITEQAVMAFKSRARISLKRREKIKSIANDVVLLSVKSENEEDVNEVNETLNIFSNVVTMNEEHVMVEEVHDTLNIFPNVETMNVEHAMVEDVMDINVLNDESLPQPTEMSFDDFNMDQSDNDVESVAGNKEWDSFCSDDTEEYKPPAKKKRIFKDKVRIPKTLKVVQPYEKLFEEELNGTSALSQLAHINVRAIYRLENGEIMPEGIAEIGTQRWQNFTFKCLECDTSSSSMFELKEHSKKKHPAVKFPLSCPGCPNSTFDEVASLINHLSLRHFEHLRFCCLFCSKLFYDIKSLWHHYQHNDEHQNLSHLYPCLCCGAYKVTLKELNLHKIEHVVSDTRMEKYREFYAADYNGVMTESLFNLNLPIEDKNDDGSVSKECEERYLRWNSMTSCCKVCKEKFSSAFDLYLHYLNVHSDAKQNFNCQICVHQNYNCILRLVSHVSTSHDSHLRYCCIVCSKMFWNFLALHNHYQSCHQCYSTWICLYCGRHSNDVARVHAHLRFHKNNVVINGEQKYRCNNCSKIFEHLESYNAHGCPKEKMREVLDKTTRKAYICEVCGVGFPNLFALDNHKLNHSDEPKGSKLAECKICHTKLKNKWSLKQHMVKHSSVKPFKCDICGFAFHYKQTRDRHLMVHSGERPHACLHCDKKFAAKFDLIIHTRLHTGEMNYECSLCDDRYPSWSNLYKHAKSKHNLDIRSEGHKNKKAAQYKSDDNSE